MLFFVPSGLVRYLKDLNPSTARSLEEGLEETLTLRLGGAQSRPLRRLMSGMIEAIGQPTFLLCEAGADGPRQLVYSSLSCHRLPTWKSDARNAALESTRPPP